MRVISKSRLRAFWELSKHRDSEGPLRAWHTHVSNRSVAWRQWSDVKATFRTASHVGNCIVFNIGGNRYRLATRIFYVSQKVFVLRVMTHAEYDDGTWKYECGCYEPPPPTTKKRRPVPTSQRKGRS